MAKQVEPVNYDAVPGCTYCDPEVGSAGLSEARARERGYEVAVGKFPFTALGKAAILGHTTGFVKVLWAEDDGRLVGAHIIGPGAPDLIAEYGLARIRCRSPACPAAWSGNPRSP